MTIRQHPHESSRAIARRLKWLGVDDKTVTRYRDRLIATAAIPQFDTLTGRDGKKRKRKNGALREKNEDPVFTCYRCDNAELIAEVAKLYLRDGDKVADVTFGRGSFWHKVDLSKYDLYKSDLQTVEEAPFDFTCLPYPDESFDVVVFDPPYVTRGKDNKQEEDHYKYRGDGGWNYGHWMNHKWGTHENLTHADIIELFQEGLEEAYRILNCGGYVWVKCADEFSSGVQRFTHCRVREIAQDIGFLDRDLFILHRLTDPQSYGKQHVARKNHSYLWIFQK